MSQPLSLRRLLIPFSTVQAVLVEWLRTAIRLQAHGCLDGATDALVFFVEDMWAWHGNHCSSRLAAAFCSSTLKLDP